MMIKCHGKTLAVLLCVLFMLAAFTFDACAEGYRESESQDEPEDSDTDETMGNPADLFFCDIVIGYEHSSWKINEDNKHPVLDYKTEGLKLYRLIGNIGYGSIPFGTFIYERPLKSSDRRDDIIETNTRQESGLEKFTGGVKLDPLVDYFIADYTLAKILLRRLLSIRYKYTRELFFGEATALHDAEFLPLNASVDYENRRIGGNLTVSKGDKISFRTEFTDNEVSIALWTFDLPISLTTDFGFSEFKVAPHDFRIGHYTSEWNRPSDTTAITIDSRPTIYEGRYKTKGVLIAIETVDIDSPGINADFSFRWGYDDSLEIAMDWERHFGQDAEVSSAMYQVGLWYNLYFSGDRYKGLFLTIGGNWSKRAVNVDVKTETDTEVKTSRAIHDTDSLTKLYALLGYRF